MTNILQKGIAAALISGAILFPCAAQAMDWNDYDESPHYAPTAMHQGYYQVDLVDTLSIDEYAPPIYILSVNSFLVSPDGTTKNIGRTTYKLNYETKEAWLLTLKKPEWFPITTATASSRDVFNKLFMKAFGIPFIAEPE